MVGRGVAPRIPNLRTSTIKNMRELSPDLALLVVSVQANISFEPRKADSHTAPH